MIDDLTSLLVISAVAVAAPALARLAGKVVPIPIVVFEILLGIAVGPSILGWATSNDHIELLSEFGLALLFFMAGNEIDFALIQGRPLRRAAFGWVGSLVLGVGIGLLLFPPMETGIIVGIALTTTALGTIMPVLRDAGLLSSRFGTSAIAVGAVGEFGPLLAISLFLSGRRPAEALVVVIVFAAITVAAIVLAGRRRHERLHRLVTATLHTSGQFAVRIALLVVVALVTLSIAMGLDMLLGAFGAGVLCRVVLRGASDADRHLVESKLEAVAFGFLVPIFFVTTGVTFDLAALVGSSSALLLLPAFLVALIVVRGLPGSFAAPPGASVRQRVSLGLFSATALPLIVAVTEIGVAEGALSEATAAALVGAGMLSCLIFPLTALSLLPGVSTHINPAASTEGEY
ncbi:cation:proton antiporter [Paeniglutamicibacter sp. NPDC091659]|uniref:cation:proton antiporter n=1 Tax=Paeniglutamicibacter sp. NPDC091659 TaxID=3364389 RepID=UPI00380AF738